MIPVVQQNRQFGQVVGSFFEITDIVYQHLDQALVIRHIRFGTVGKEGES